MVIWNEGVDAAGLADLSITCRRGCAAMKLSVVPIARNQSEQVPRLVRSVLEELERLEVDSEVLFVDSASEDGTAEAAATYPVRVITLSPEQRLTASAARYVGFKETSGEYVLFLDGDMELLPGWLAAAIRLLDSSEGVAAVTGQRIDANPASSGPRPPFAEVELSEVGERDVHHGGGAALYRRSSLEQVGTFNPYLYSDEEPELCIRLRFGGGYRIVQLETPHVIHYTSPVDEIPTLVRRAQRRLYFGSGQVIRYSWGSPFLGPYLRERGFGLLPALWLLAGLAYVAASWYSRSVIWVVAWGIIVFLVVAAGAVRRRSIHEALVSVTKRTLHVIGTVRGLILTPLPPESYPAHHRVVQDQSKNRPRL